jgi:hypothetical protein
MRFDNEMTGMLAPRPEPFEPELGICWPSDISEERKAAILANPNFTRYLSGQPPQEQMRQIYLWRPPVDPGVEARRQAELEAARERRAAELAALPTHEELCRLVRTLEAHAIQMRTRIAALEEAHAKSRPAKVSRISRTAHSTPPDAA